MEKFKQLKNENDLEGKIIKRVISADGKMVIHFYNNEFCIIKNAGYDMDYIEIDDYDYGFHISEYSIRELKYRGFLSEEEYKTYFEKFEEERLAQFEKDERNLFYRLKEKYDGTSNN